MRLTTIKLAGFKSFVDPTTLHLPTNMTGVVGPNGCGKSNIIDAIRWVMGESAASRLRGDALVDVIFSGSTSRKPVGSAMVELLFDNSDGLLGGEYAGYNEISVKRLVSRDGQSHYFLNGVRCRRRDITDLFLGTGLGPRSYSIIEQGMISEIVEADPEQLRIHLEEAAGISRYKERRKETESRMRSTRENLDRVRDVRDEVDKQLEHLKRQARTAERWQALKDDQNKKTSEVKALQWRLAKSALEGHCDALHKAELSIEEQLAGQRHVESALETRREEHTGASDHLGAVQAEIYRVGADIARIDQQIQHRKELVEQLEHAKRETEHARAQAGKHVETDNERLTEHRSLLAASESELESLHATENQASDSLREVDARLAEWQDECDAHVRATAQSSQSAEIERTRLDYLDQQCLHAEQRKTALANEGKETDTAEMSRMLETIDREHAGLGEQVRVQTALLEQRRAAAETALEQERAAHTTLSGARAHLESLRGRLASLEALQHAALEENGDLVRTWLQQRGLGTSLRLAESLQVDAGWERAVETVLDGWLNAVLVDDPGAIGNELAGLTGLDLSLMDVAAGDPALYEDSLAARARGPRTALRMLAQVRCIESLEGARELLANLDANHSLITRDGEWLGRGFARVLRGSGAKVGVLAREGEIRQSGARVREVESEIAAHVASLDRNQQIRIGAERVRDEAQSELHESHRRFAEAAGRLQGHRGKVASSLERMARLTEETAELDAALASDRELVRQARGRLEAAIAHMGELEQRRQELDTRRRHFLEGREDARMSAREASEAVHRMALAIESHRAAAVSLEQSVARMRDQIAHLDERHNEITAQLASGQHPDGTLEDERQSHLNRRLVVDRQMVGARQALQEHEVELRRLEQERHRFEQVLNEQRDSLSQLRLHEQEHRLHATALATAIGEAGFELTPLLEGLPPDADAEKWQSNLIGIDEKIRRLEPVNLAAIQEYEEQSRRKTYLDAQLADLTTALETLEGAIRRIDKETRARFKETFERVNAGVSELFPRLFGGGHAHLELTGDDLLSTGVTIMARPPGKRVSSISLLSGGEKAMTAVALVFAIFRLNPAPFCLLDEVDAPLDEANIGRFCSLVAEMSEHVQFIFVSHNRSTMEAASQLCGVTMREPGVSRLVQVDLAEAARLAGAA